MRRLISDAVIAVIAPLLRRIDPSVADVHLCRYERPFGDELPIPAASDPCMPRSQAVITWL